jgi:WD40 repeat protein
MIGHRGPISGVACWRDTYVATAGYDNQVILWDAATATSSMRVQHDHLANQCAFSPDGKWLVSSSSDYSARLWSVPGLRLHAVLDVHEDDVEMSVFHPTAELIATASRDHQVRVFDFTGTLVKTFRGHTADVISIEWSADGDGLISSSDDGTVKRWSFATGQLVSNLDMDGVETDTVVLTADGVIYAGNDEGDIVTVRLDGSRTKIHAHDSGVKRLVLGVSQGLLVSLSYDRTAKMWDLTGSDLTLVNSTTVPDDVWARSCAFGGGESLIFGTFGRTYRTFDYGLNQWEAMLVPPTYGVNAVVPLSRPGEVLTIGDAGIVRCEYTLGGGNEVARMGSLCNFLTPIDELVLTGGQLGKMFDALTGRSLYQHRSPLNCGTRFTRSGHGHALIGSYTGEGLIFRVEGAETTHVGNLPMLRNAIKGVAAGDRLLFAVCADCSVTWWDAETLEHVRTVRNAHDRIINGCVSIGGDQFATVGRDLMLRIWSPSGQAEVLHTPHRNSIKCISATDDGQVIATGGYHGMIALVELSSRSWIQVQRPTTSGISSLSYDAASRTFIAGSYDGNVYRISRDRPPAPASRGPK